jgi:hypothetical protein
VLVVIGVLVGVAAVALAVVVAGGTGGTVTTPFLSYTPPAGWSTAPPDPAVVLDAPALVAPALVGTVHGPRYTCGDEEFLRGFAASALLPTDATTGPADRAERVAKWFAATMYPGADGTPPDVTVSPLRSVRVAGPDGPVDGTVTEAIVRVVGGRGDCAATAGRVLVLAVPSSGGAALLLVAGDTEGGPAAVPPPTPSALDTVVANARIPAA